MTDEIVKPVYKTGDSVGSIVASNTAAIEAPAPAPIPAPAEPAAPIAAIPDTPVPDTPAPTPATEERNVSTFSIPDLDAPAAAPVAATPVSDWRDAIKKADVKEILKEIGFNDFAIEINEHIKNGGDAADYLSAKAIDYNKVSDENIVKDDLRKQYPSFTPSQIDLMYSRRYSVSEDASDEDREFVSLQIKADAHNKRQSLISEQQKFKIPAAAQVDNGQQAQIQQQQIEAARQWFAEHDATKSLMTSKRVALNLGDNGTFNFSIERPELLMQAVTDGETWQKLTRNKQGEPDVVKMQKIALYAFNPEQFENDLVNYGKSLALPGVLQEGQNLTPQAKVIPVQGMNVPEKDLWKNAKSSTIGGR